MPGSNHTVSRPLLSNLNSIGLFGFQVPPPPYPVYPPSAMEQFFILSLALVLISTLVLLMVPEKWSSKIVRIAFCRKGRD